MCFFVPKNTRAKIAKKDITCYKLLYDFVGGPTSTIYNFTYKLGKVNKKIVLRITRENYLVLGKNYYIHVHDDMKQTSYRVINCGYHSYIDKPLFPKAEAEDEAAYFECTIPKGTKYYEDSIGGVRVSETIIINRKL
jgi:hypothetical protein